MRKKQHCWHQTYPVRGEIQHSFFGAFEDFRLACHVTEGELHIFALFEDTAGRNQMGWRDKLGDSSDTYPHHTEQGTAQQNSEYYPEVLLWPPLFWLWTERDDLCGLEEFILSSETSPAPPSTRAPLIYRAVSTSKGVRLRNSTPHTKTLSPKIRAQKGLRRQKPSPWCPQPSPWWNVRAFLPPQPMLKSSPLHWKTALLWHHTHCANWGSGCTETLRADPASHDSSKLL